MSIGAEVKFSGLRSGFLVITSSLMLAGCTSISIPEEPLDRNITGRELSAHVQFLAQPDGSFPRTSNFLPSLH
jgi:hypothetical protein